MKILALTKHNSGVDYHRISLPIKYWDLGVGDNIIEVSNRTTLIGELFDGVDIVIFSRECPFSLNSILSFKQEYEFKIVVDIDDYWKLPPHHLLYEDWKKNKTDLSILQSLISADLVTTTNEYLREKILPYQSNVEIIPNALPYGFEQFTNIKKNINTILYSSSATHLYDLRSLSTFFSFCKKDKEVQKHTFALGGYDDRNIYSKVVWDAIELEAKGFGNYTRFSAMPLDSYMHHYRYCNIAIAPLEDNEFNKCKSFLKGLEAGCKDIPLLASAIHPYTELPVIHCKTQRDWYDNLRMLVKRPEIREEKGKILGNYVRNEYNLKQINKRRKEIYESI